MQFIMFKYVYEALASVRRSVNTVLAEEVTAEKVVEVGMWALQGHIGGLPPPPSSFFRPLLPFSFPASSLSLLSPGPGLTPHGLGEVLPHLTGSTHTTQESRSPGHH